MARTIQYFEIFLIKLLNHDNFENIKNVKDLQRANNNVKKNYFFFLSGFSFTNIHDSRNSRERGRVFI